MSWYVTVSGKSSKLAEVVKDKFVNTQGCPKGSEEEAAKNALGEVAEMLCKSLESDKVVSIIASGSAWNLPTGKAGSQSCEFKFITISDFVE